MHVSRLEIFGFKSFMERLVLPVEKGITGIVGPNGCGKSNIIDALRWVLGETNARSLRGGTLEDVIFNGTDKLRPLGLAEVSITLRANDDNFFADLVSPALEAELFAEQEEAAALAELEAAERAVGSGEVAAPTDVVDFGHGADENVGIDSVMDEGAVGEGAVQVEDVQVEDDARPALRVIQGGLSEADVEPKVDNASPDTDGDAPQDLGELQPAERKASDAAGAARLMNRFSWLKSMSEVQVTRRYYRSGESEFFINRVPCRLKDLRELFRAVGLGARTYTIVAQGEVSRVVTARSDERRRILEEAAGVQGFRDKIAAAGRRLVDTDTNITRIDDVLKEMERQVASLKRQAARAQNREVLKKELASVEKALFRDRFFELKEKETSLKILQEAAAEREESLRIDLVTLQTEEEDARTELMGVDTEGDDLRYRIDALREELNNRSRQRGEKLGRLKELRAFLLSQEAELLRLEERRSMMAERRAEADDAMSELRAEAIALHEQLEAVDLSGVERLAELGKLMHSGRDELRVKDSALRQKREDLIKRESRLESVKEQLIAASPINQLKQTLDGDGLDALRELTDGTMLLVDGVTVPERYTRALQAVLGEKAAFLVSDKPFEVARYFVQQALPAMEDSTGVGIGVMRSGSQEPPRLSSVPFRRLLDFIEAKAECSLALQRTLAEVYVSEELETALRFFESGQGATGITIVTLEGELVTDHSFYSFRHEAGVVQLKQEQDELAEMVAELTEATGRLEADREQLAASLFAYEEEHAELVETTQVRQAEARQLESQLGAVSGRLEGLERQLDQVRFDEERVIAQEGEARFRMTEHLEEQELVQTELAEMTSDSESELQAELQELTTEYSQLDGARSETRTRLGHLVQRLEETRRSLDQARSKVSQSQLEMQRVSLEEEHLRERVVYEYGEGAYADVSSLTSELAQRVSEVERKEFEERASQIRTRIMREGDVDMSSIERLQEELVRFADLQRQRQDLEKAAQTLRKTIERLTETSEQRFLATFERVRANFSRLIPKLFGGGRGELELSDPSKPLDSGLEIIARPPGKKLKSIELLSGGEKALCATALIFALFLERPSPLCVLDEVDAPLDDANQVRFVNLVREMSNRTQFLMITHNKISMQAADNLVGVTMETPGASRVLSVSLREAIEHVA